MKKYKITPYAIRIAGLYLSIDEGNIDKKIRKTLSRCIRATYKKEDIPLSFIAPVCEEFEDISLEEFMSFINWRHGEKLYKLEKDIEIVIGDLDNVDIDNFSRADLVDIIQDSVSFIHMNILEPVRELQK